MLLLHRLTPTLLRVVFSLVSISIAVDGRAQTKIDVETWKHAEERIKAIYDRNEFRAKAFRPIWLGDSSGIVVEERDETGSKRCAGCMKQPVASGANTTTTSRSQRHPIPTSHPAGNIACLQIALRCDLST